MALVPFVEIANHFQEATQPPLIDDIMGERLWRQGGSPPGARAGYVRQALSKETQFLEDPLAGQVPFRPRILHHDYEIGWNDRGIGAWEPIPTPEESEAKILAKNYYEAIRDELFAEGEFTDSQKTTLQSKTSTAASRKAILEASQLSENGQEQLAAALSYIPQFDTGGSGFLKEAYNLFDIGTTVRGIVWDFSVPNVPKTLISTFELKQDRWESFRLFRSSLDEDQADGDFEIVIGNGTTQYALVFRKEEAVEFRHYRNMKARERGVIEEQLKAVLDTGRLTPANMAEITSLKRQINDLKKNSKGAGQSKPNGDDAKKIASLSLRIEKIKESKSGLTDVNRALKEKLEQKLYYDVFQVSLQEDARSLFNVVFDVSISFHRKGLIGIRIGRGEPVYVEIKGITKTLKYGTMLPKGCRIMIRSQGGKFSISEGNPQFTNHALLYGQPFALPYSLGDTVSRGGRLFVDPESYSVELDAVGIGEDLAAPGDNLALLPGCRMEINVEQLRALQVAGENQVVVEPALYRLCLESWSAPDSVSKKSEFTPEIYRGSIFAQGGPPPPLTEPGWDSRAKRYPITDVLLQDDGERAAMHEVVCDDNTRKAAELPVDLDGRAASLGVTNDLTGEVTYLVKNGVAKSPGGNDVAHILTNETPVTFAVARRATTTTKFNIHGIETLLDRPVRYQLIGNNRPPAAYAKDLILAHGLHEEFVALLPDEYIPGLERLPKASAGKPADIKPQLGTSLFNFIRGDIFGKHCIGWRFVVDPIEHCKVEEEADRDRPDLMYSTRVPHSHPFAVLGPLNFRQDTSDYVSELLVTGAFNPARGERFNSYFRRYEASKKKGSAYFTGVDYTMITVADESLKSQTHVDLYARRIEETKGLPPIVVEATVWYRPDLKTGIIPRLNGVRFVIKGIQRSPLQIAKRQTCVLSLRLADDILFGGAL